MLAPWSIACKGSEARGRLKHSWLENQVLNKSPDDVVHLRRGGGWPALEQDFERRLDEVRGLAETLEAAFSPSQLIARLPVLAGLDVELKERIASAVHAAYLESSTMAELQRVMKERVASVARSLAAVLAVWHQPCSDSVEDALRASWEELRREADALHAVLERLPRGVVLP